MGRVCTWAQLELRLQVNHGGGGGGCRPVLQDPLRPRHHPPEQQVSARSGFTRLLFQLGPRLNAQLCPNISP